MIICRREMTSTIAGLHESPVFVMTICVSDQDIECQIPLKYIKGCANPVWRGPIQRWRGPILAKGPFDSSEGKNLLDSSSTGWDDGSRRVWSLLDLISSYGYDLAGITGLLGSLRVLLGSRTDFTSEEQKKIRELIVSLQSNLGGHPNPANGGHLKTGQ